LRTSCLCIFLFSKTPEARSFNLKTTSIRHMILWYFNMKNNRWFPRSKNGWFSSGSSISK
jgi:hypothetical protein